MTTALLLVGHGSRVPEAATEMARLAALVRARVEVPVSFGWLDHAEPLATDAGVEQLRGGAHRIVLVPLLLFSAYHARVDVPEVAETLRSVDPSAQVVIAKHLGLDPSLVSLAVLRVDAVAQPEDGLLVASSGSSDPDAQAAAATAARMVAERTGHVHVQHAFAASAEPTVSDAVGELASRGVPRVTFFSWSLFAGRLVRECRDDATRAAADAGVDLIDAGRFGPDPIVADILVDRFRRAAF